MSISRDGISSRIDAIADDGTAWWRWPDASCSWHQHPPLPAHVVPADA